MSDPLAVVLALVEECSPQGVVELERALTAHLRDEETPRERRVRELLPLAELLESGHAVRIPGHPVAEARIARQDYDRLRPEGAPSSEALADRFGGEDRAGWLYVCSAAHGLLPDGRKRGQPLAWPTGLRGNPQPTHSGGEAVTRSIRACALALGRRPNSAIYEEWVGRRRRAARQHGGARAVDKLALRRLSQVYDHFPDWDSALRAADITDAEHAAARAKRLTVVDPEQLPEGPPKPAERFEELQEDQLDALELTAVERRRSARGDYAKLELGRAAALAHALGGSLDWLAGRVEDPGEPSRVRVRLSQRALTEARQRQCVSEEYLWRRAKLGQEGWWDVLRGVRQPTLGQLKRWADIIEVSIAELVE